MTQALGAGTKDRTRSSSEGIRSPDRDAMITTGTVTS